MRILAYTLVLLSFSTHTLVVAEESISRQVSKDFTAVAKKAIPAVVAIQVKGKKVFGGSLEPSDGDDFFQRFFALPHSMEQQVVGQASGFIVSPDGYIMTNGHVVQDATEILVTLQDDGQFPAKVVGLDKNTDVALIKIDAKNLPYLKLGNSDDLETGQWVIAIGNPFGLQASLTVGVVSAKGRNNLDLVNVEDFIQTDAAINRGNSGGPLLNLDAEVIGMNTAIVTNSGAGGYVGIGFAIPSNIAKHVMDQLIATGSVSRGYIGVALQTVDHDLAHAFGLAQAGGAAVADVQKGSPAEKAGIKQGDIIKSYNNLSVQNIASLRNAIVLMSPGATINLTVLRGDKTLQIPVEVALFPSTAAPAAVQGSENPLGFSVQELTPELARSLNVTEEKGVVITSVDPHSTAALTGLKKGALVVAVNQKPVSTVAEFNAALQETPEHRPVLLLVKQGESIRFISIKVS